MNEQDISIDRRKAQGQRANIHVSIRITKPMSVWLKDKKYSPTGLFLAACNEMGYKEKD